MFEKTKAKRRIKKYMNIVSKKKRPGAYELQGLEKSRKLWTSKRNSSFRREIFTNQNNNEPVNIYKK